MFYLDLEFRKEYRYDHTYKVCRNIAAILDGQRAVDPLVLVPPTNFLQTKGVKDFEVVEPAIFYYYVGVRTVNVNSPGFEKANWVMVAPKQKVGIRRIKDGNDWQNYVDTFKSYIPAL